MMNLKLFRFSEIKFGKNAAHTHTDWEILEKNGAFGKWLKKCI